jgi:hypothetical protein
VPGIRIPQAIEKIEVEGGMVMIQEKVAMPEQPGLICPTEAVRTGLEIIHYIHTLPIPKRYPENSATSYYPYQGERYINRDNKLSEAVYLFQRRIFRHMGPTTLYAERSVFHGDLAPDFKNYRRLGDENIVLFDFNNSGVGNRLTDLALYLTYTNYIHNYHNTYIAELDDAVNVILNSNHELNARGIMFMSISMHTAKLFSILRYPEPEDVRRRAYAHINSIEDNLNRLGINISTARLKEIFDRKRVLAALISRYQQTTGNI